jgi:hypothetical protein
MSPAADREILAPCLVLSDGAGRQRAASSASDERPNEAAALGRATAAGPSAGATPTRAAWASLQLAYIVAAAFLGALVPRVQVGSVPAERASQMLFAIAAGVLPLLGIVYSLLFLVVQWGHSMFTPRLDLFRDHPVVWHAFGRPGSPGHP